MYPLDMTISTWRFIIHYGEYIQTSHYFEVFHTLLLVEEWAPLCALVMVKEPLAHKDPRLLLLDALLEKLAEAWSWGTHWSGSLSCSWNVSTFVELKKNIMKTIAVMWATWTQRLCPYPTPPASPAGRAGLEIASRALQVLLSKAAVWKPHRTQ